MEPQILSTKQKLRSLEARLHQANQSQEIRDVVELVELYKAEAMRSAIDKDRDREIDIGRVRGFEQILRAITVSPPTIYDFKATK